MNEKDLDSLRKQLSEFECVDASHPSFEKLVTLVMTMWEAGMLVGKIEHSLDDIERRINKLEPIYRWNSIQGHDYLDVEGLGRYLIKRDYKGAHHFRAFLNNERTIYLGKTIHDVKAKVEADISFVKAAREKEKKS